MVSFRELRELQRVNESSHMGPGATEYAKPFGSDIKHKMHFGGKYKFKANNNPPPGLYDPKPEATKPKAPGFSMDQTTSGRSDFTSSPMKDNQSGGQYDKHLTPFGADVKQTMTLGGKYKWKPDSNPPPGLYDVEAAKNYAMPKSRAAKIMDHPKFAVYN